MARMVPILGAAAFAMAILLAPAASAAAFDLPKEVLAETNLARTDPARYADHLRELRRLFVGKAYRLQGTAGMVMTSEGVAAVDEAIGFLARQKPLPALSWSKGLAEAAWELVRDQAKTGSIGHDTAGGMRERIERHGTWSGRIGENIGYGPSTARLMVMELIIDDGVPDRGHRRNIFSTDYATAGAACGPHPVYRHMCVIDFATRFRERPVRPPRPGSTARPG